MTNDALSLRERAQLLPYAEAAGRAVGRLDAAVLASPIRAAWMARTRLHAEARAAALGGASVSAAAFFRGLVGLMAPAEWRHIDWRRLSLSVALARSDRGAPSPAGQLIEHLTERSGFLVPPALLDELPAYRVAARRLAALLGPAATLVEAGVELARVLRAPLDELAPAPLLPALDVLVPERPWVGSLLAPRLCEWLAASGLTSTPLPCLVPLRPSMRFETMTAGDVCKAFLEEIAQQADAGLELLRRLEACAAAWRSRLAPATARSRSLEAAALFLVLPALTRPQVARALGVSSPGAAKILEPLIEAGILAVEALSERHRFWVAGESLADFKLRPRQGRHRAAPLPPAVAWPLLDELEAAMADLDRALPPGELVPS